MSRARVLLLPAACTTALVLAHPGTAEESGAAAQAATGGAGPGVLVVDLLDNTPEEAIAALEARLGVDLQYSSAVSADEALLRAEVPDLEAALALLAGDPLVEVAEPALELEALGYPDDPLWSKQWNLRRVDAPAGWRAGAGRGVRVAVLDTGVSPVEDLGGVRLHEGRSFVPGAPTAADDHGHGTHVAGTIAQATHNGLGVAGVAPNVELLPYKVLSRSGSGSSDHIAAAIDEAVDQGAQVINLSLGSPVYSRVIHHAIVRAHDAGVLVVAAAGNTGREGVSWPGKAAEALGVSATDPDDALSFYSSWGPGVDIAAPGGDTRREDGGILQDTIDGRGGHSYRALQGTSMATPHVAGAAAVLMGLGLGPDEAASALARGAVDLGKPGFDSQFGHGRIDLGATLRELAWRRNGLRGAVALSLGWALASLAGLSLGRRAAVAGAAFAAAGGLLGLVLLPLPPNPVIAAAAHGWLGAPALAGLDLGRNALWMSALAPGLLAFTLGWTRGLGPLIAGLNLAVGAALVQAGAEGSVRLDWLPGPLGGAWLGLNGALALLFGLAVLGAQRRR